ncbi:hypothetical protein [Streptomyces sp. NPDC048521]|uniref:hypothetical protein n=1 Tax=Streptomyces sp. NPDC048521 TaxID=3365566 RepID=UPI00371D0A73
MMYFLAPLSLALVVVALMTAVLVHRDRRLAHAYLGPACTPRVPSTPGPHD